MGRHPPHWLVVLLCAAVAGAQDAATPPAKQGPPQPAKQTPGQQPPGKQQPGQPGQGAPGQRPPGQPQPGGGAAGQPGRPGARPGQRARAAQRPVRPETMPPQLVSVSGSGEPIALALADDGARLYSLEGTSLVVLDSSKPTLPEIRRIPLDATVLGMQASGKQLYIAGDTAGLGVLSLEVPQPTAPAASPTAPAEAPDAAPPTAPAGAPARTARGTQPATPPGARRGAAQGAGGTGAPAVAPPPEPAVAPPAPPSVQWIDATSDKPCTAVALSDQLLLATFASERESELRVYLRGTHQIAGKVTISGRALDVAVNGPFAYLAMGQVGVVRADLRFLKQPKLARGPDLTIVQLPDHFRLKRGFAREVAVGGTHLYVAADAAGLVDIDLEKPWGTLESFDARPLAFLGRMAYAVRVDARGDQVVVGTARLPALVGDGAPTGLLGGRNWDLSSGDVPAGDWQPGASEALWVFRRPNGGELELAAIEPIEDSSWRSLTLRGRRVYELHAKLGVVVREIAIEPRLAQAGDAKVPLQGTVTIVGRRKSRGLACLDGKPSLQDPRLFLFGVDPHGCDGKGFLRMAQGEKLQPVPELVQQPSVGTSVGAQWPDAMASREWFMSGGTRAWRVNRFTHRPKVRVDSWELVPPEPPDAGLGGSRGRSVFHSAADGDLILATRDGTRFGLVGYSIKHLERVLGEGTPGGRVMAKPLWQLQTHFEGERPTCSTWRVKVFALEDGRRIAAIAAGANTDPESEHFEAPQLVLYDVTSGSATTPRKLAVAWGDEKQGLAVSVDVCQIRNRSYAAVATSGGQLLIFDVNVPDRPRLVRSFRAPTSTYDGRREGLFDVEIATDPASSRSFAYLAAGRAGLIRVELSATGDDLAPDTLLDTPGWASGVASTVIGGERYWLVGDQRAGLRLYR